MSGRPDFNVVIKQKDAKHSTKIGAAWRTKDGSGINIKLDAGVSVGTPDGVFLTLWPFESKEEREARFNGGGGQRQQPSGGYGGRQSSGSGGTDDDYLF